MKSFFKEYGGWILSGVLITVILFMVFQKKTDYSGQQKIYDDAQAVRDSVRPVIDSLTNELKQTETIVTKAEAETDSISSLLLEANNKLIYAYQNEKRRIRVDNIGSDSLRKLYSEITRFYESRK